MVPGQVVFDFLPGHLLRFPLDRVVRSGRGLQLDQQRLILGMDLLLPAAAAVVVAV